MADITAKNNVDSVDQTDPPSAAAQPLDTSQPTTGEKYYNRFKFIAAEGFILAATAAIAYVARYGKASYAGIPNYLQKFQNWFDNKLVKNRLYELDESTPIKKRLAQAAAATMVTFHGGNLFAPIMKFLEDNKSHIVDNLNQRYGKEGEVELGREHLKHEPKQTWGDIIKGRMAGFGTVFTSFATMDILLGKDKSAAKPRYRFDKFEDWFGRKVAGFTVGGKELSKIPMTQELTAEMTKNKSYRFGKILALDIYATTAAIMIWNAISHLSAKNRVTAEQTATDDQSNNETTPAPVVETPPASTQTVSHAEKVKPSGNKEKGLEGKAASYAKLITSQQQAAEQQSHTISG